MIYFCIPAHNEARTIGVLLWKLREVMEDLSPDYRIVVLDDASTDATREVLEPYVRVLPLTVLRNERRKGYAKAVETMLRKAAEHTSYPRRDAAVVLQADFTDEPEQIPALIKRIESGADLVIGAIQRNGDSSRESAPARWLRGIADRLLRRVDWPDQVSDPLSGFRAYRLVCVKKALAARNGQPLIRRKGWAANVELLHTLIPYARRVEEVPVHFERGRRGRNTRLGLRDLLHELKAFIRLRAPRTSAPVVGGELGRNRKSKRRSAGGGGDGRGGGRRSGRGAASMIALALVASMFAVAPARAQLDGFTRDNGGTPAIHPVPFGLGERMEYEVKLSPFGSVGRGSMEVVDLDTIRGHITYNLRFDLEARAMLVASVDDRMESWLDISELIAHRFEQDQDELTFERHRILDFLTTEGTWVRSDLDPSIEGRTGPLATERPLDDVSFLYFARTLPLEVGETYTLERYWKEDGNPVVLKVLGKEEVTVPAGSFNTIVVRPIIQTDGLFGDGGKAKVYFTDDERRLLVKMESNVPVLGSLSLHLVSYTPGIKISPLTFH